MTPKISFSEAAITLERLCDEIDQSDLIADNVITIFKQSAEDLSSAVDRRLAYLKYAEAQIVTAKDMYDKWKDRADKFARVVERIKADTLATMKANPNLPYKGMLGAFRIQRNSQPSLIIEDEAVLLESSTWTIEKVELDKAQIKKALMGGIEIPSARLEYGEHLRIGVK